MLSDKNNGMCVKSCKNNERLVGGKCVQSGNIKGKGRRDNIQAKIIHIYK